MLMQKFEAFAQRVTNSTPSCNYRAGVVYRRRQIGLSSLTTNDVTNNGRTKQFKVTKGEVGEV